MALKDIEKQIYQKEDRNTLDKERTQNTPYSVYAKHQDVANPVFKPFEEAEMTFFQKHKKKITLWTLIGLTLFVTVGVIGFFYTLNQQRFSDKRVRIEIKGEAQVSAGDEVTYTLTYRNDNLVALRNAEITVNLPEALNDPSLNLLGQTRSDVRSFELPELAPRSQGEIIIKGRLIGEQGSIHTIRSTLTYIPTIVTASFETKAEFATTIADSPVVIDIQAPLESVGGDTVDYIVTVNNKGDRDLSNLELKVEYPDTFAFTSATLPPNGNEQNLFDIPQLKAKGNYSVTISGNLGGNVQDVKIIKAQIGETREGVFTLYANSQNSTRLGNPYVSVVQTVGSRSGVVSAGDLLEYSVTIRNNTQVRIGEGALKVKLDSNLLDITKLKAQGADFDAGTNTIIWRANTLPQLRSFAPNEEGSVTFSVPVKKTIPIDDFQDINYVIKTQATFESDEVPTELGVNRIIQGNSSTVKLATKIFPKSSITYRNTDNSIVNSGPIPLKIAQKTTFTVNWEIRNLSNDVSGSTFKATLPANVTWTGQSTTNGFGTLTYNDRTKEIVWDIGNVPANTGILRPLYKAIFQIEIVPTANQLGQEPSLLSAIQYTGKDVFTGIDLSGTINASSGRQVSDISGSFNVEN